MSEFGGSPESLEAQREFAEAEKIRLPASLTELVQATDDAFLLAEADLALEVSPEDEDKPNTASLEAWILATDRLDDTFLATDGGALGGKLLDLLALSDTDFKKPEHLTFATDVLVNAAPIAKDLNILIDRLVQLNHGSTRETIVERLRSGKLPTSTRVQNISITPRRHSLLGVLIELSNRVEASNGNASPETDAWKLEREIVLPTTITIADPFSSQDARVQTWWEDRLVAAKNTVPNREHTILTVSGDVTRRTEFELANLADRVTDPEYKAACAFLATWLAEKSIYYQDPDPRDFELYHIGMEQPAELMELMRSLDLIKKHDPQLFVELCGLNPVDGGPSPYYGSFLHKSLGNTQKLVDKAGESLGDLALKTMMKQLFQMDERVRTYQGVVSQENLKQMAAQAKGAIESQKTDAGKATMLALLGVPLIPLAIDAEVRRQLEALRAFNREQVREELQRHLDDLEHPLKLIDYITHMPRSAFTDPVVRKALQPIVGNQKPEEFQTTDIQTFDTTIRGVMPRTESGQKNTDWIRNIYARIPLVDPTKPDFGYGKRDQIARRDFAQLDSVTRWVQGRGDMDQTIIGVIVRPNLIQNPDVDQPATFGFQIVDSIRPIDIERAKQLPADQVFLATIAHPKGHEVAWVNFAFFTEQMGPEKMHRLLEDHGSPVQHPAITEFWNRFFTGEPRKNPRLVNPYLTSLRNSVSHTEGKANVVARLLQIWTVIEKGETPWTIRPSELATPLQTLSSKSGGAIDLYEIKSALEEDYRARGRHRVFPEKLPELTEAERNELALDLGRQFQPDPPPIGRLHYKIANLLHIHRDDEDANLRLLNTVRDRIRMNQARG